MTVILFSLLPNAALPEVHRAATVDLRVSEAEKHLVFFRATLDPLAVEHRPDHAIILIEGSDVMGFLDGRDIEQALSGQLRRNIRRLAISGMLKPGVISSSDVGVIRIDSELEGGVGLA